MKSRKWQIFFTMLVLTAGTAGVLSWLKAHQRLGEPGIKATPIPGSVMMKIDLPEHALDYSSTNIPESEEVLGYLPKDTSFAERYYQASDGFGVFATIVLMGADRTSIHRPDYCLPGHGWTIESKTAANIPIAGEHPYGLPVLKWVARNSMRLANGETQEVNGIYVFWFVAENEQTPDYVKFQYYLLRDLLFTGRLQRWAYISYFAVCAPGQEDATFERMKKLIAATVPEYQLPPGKR